MVAATLICLSELVPILGADTVVGGKRTRLFTDGRPNIKNTNFILKTKTLAPKSLNDFACSERVFLEESNVIPMLNERPPPVGGEADDLIVGESTYYNNLIASEEDWSDWEGNNQQLTLIDDDRRLSNQNNVITNSFEDSPPGCYDKPSDSTAHKMNNIVLQKAALEAKKNMIDISDLDIKNQKFECSKKSSDEFDFFADMVPVIEKPSVAAVASADSLEFSKLNFVPDDGINEDDEGGWSDD